MAVHLSVVCATLEITLYGYHHAMYDNLMHNTWMDSKDPVWYRSRHHLPDCMEKDLHAEPKCESELWVEIHHLMTVPCKRTLMQTQKKHPQLSALRVHKHSVLCVPGSTKRRSKMDSHHDLPFTAKLSTVTYHCNLSIANSRVVGWSHRLTSLVFALAPEGPAEHRHGYLGNALGNTA